MLKKLNLIFFGGFDYPRGMAGTKRIQNAINGLKDYPGISLHVLIVRQSRLFNVLMGTHNGIAYETVTDELSRIKKLIMSPVIYAKTQRILQGLFRPDKHNILYVFGPPDFDTAPSIRYARSIGYKIIFDIVEDDDLIRVIFSNFWNRLANKYVRHAIKNISSLADGILVVSSHLERKYRELTRGTVPIHYLPISVDLNRYPEAHHRFGEPVTFLYSGSFGMKDGVPVLLEAFDKLAEMHQNIRLVMVGMGNDEMMSMVHGRIKVSPHQMRIIYKGYLDDAAYAEELTGADILCMPRINMEYAQAGFPFKLGEYLATGKPVIASAVSDIPGLLKDYIDAILVTPGSSDAIVEAAEFLLNDHQNALAIGAQGRTIAEHLFDYRAQGKKLYAFLCNVAGELG